MFHTLYLLLFTSINGKYTLHISITCSLISYYLLIYILNSLLSHSHHLIFEFYYLIMLKYLKKNNSRLILLDNLLSKVGFYEESFCLYLIAHYNDLKIHSFISSMIIYQYFFIIMLVIFLTFLIVIIIFASSIKHLPFISLS
jgi:hypothetical protein